MRTTATPQSNISRFCQNAHFLSVSMLFAFKFHKKKAITFNDRWPNLTTDVKNVTNGIFKAQSVDFN